MEERPFKLVSPYQPTGDQPEAIQQLVAGGAAGGPLPDPAGRHRQRQDLYHGQRHCPVQPAYPGAGPQQDAGRPSCAPSSGPFSLRMRWSISSPYYDYYQPEAYIPSTDTYIEKDSAINDEIDRLRHSATAALSERRDVIIVASVSCIYSLGDPHRLPQHGHQPAAGHGDEPGGAVPPSGKPSI